MKLFTWQVATTGSEATEKLAESIGFSLKGGEAIELVSDLGGGKTTFTRGLARGAGSSDHVSSPTFTLRNEYRAPGFTIYHFDFYRLNEAGIMADELAEVIGDQSSVTVVEWGQGVADVLPTERVTIELKAGQSGDDNSRQLIIKYPENLSYLINQK